MPETRDSDWSWGDYLRRNNDELVATGKIIAVTIDPETKKPARVPDVFREAVARFERE